MENNEDSPKENFHFTKSLNLKPFFNDSDSLERQNEDDFPNNLMKLSENFLKSPKKFQINKRIKFTTKKRNIFSVVLNKNKKSKPQNNNNNKNDDNNNKIYSKGRWSKEERQQFALSLKEYGPDWKKISNIIKTRSSNQIISHAQKFLPKLVTNTYIIQKGIDIKNLDWGKSLKCLKDNLNDNELLFILTSVECDIGDNNRMTKKYLEEKSSKIRKKFHSLSQEEKNNYKDELYPLNNNNNINIINECNTDYEKINNNNAHPKDEFFFVKDKGNDNIFFNDNLNIFSFENNNIFNKES
jgi:SHAQKYF class myb-like DNA-binding protein